jgi:RNA polymerase sigma-70 factor (ECF subfamily)
LALVYEDLRGRARGLLARERKGHTLQPTPLVHEAWLRLIDQDRATFEGRAHFLAIATTVMRRILVDHARKRDATKRGGDMQRVTLDEELGLPQTEAGISVLDLDRMLTRLAEVDARRAEVASLCLFGGLEPKEIAEAQGTSRRTVERDWKAARAFLLAELGA